MIIQKEKENQKKEKERKENLLNSGLCRPGRPLSENQRKQKERQILEPCQRTKKMYGS